MVVKGENYTFTFNNDVIDIVPKVHGLDEIHIHNNYDEDFSVFELGPYIAGDIEMLAAYCVISTTTYNNIYIKVLQSPGDYIIIEIRKQPEDISTGVINNGEQIYLLKDYVLGYN